MRAHGILFHHFHGGDHPRGQGSISATELDRLVAGVGRHRIITAREWFDRAVAGTLDGSSICLTFDDNLRCQYDIALPILEAHGITAFWFVYTGPLTGEPDRLEIYRYFRTVAFPDVEAFYRDFDRCLMRGAHAAEVRARVAAVDIRGYLAEKPFYTEADRRFRYIRTEILGPERYDAIMRDLMRLKDFDPAAAGTRLWIDAAGLRRLHLDGHLIGLHSHTHPTNMAALCEAEQEREFAANRDALAAILGERPATMAHPAGSYRAETLDILKRLGIKVGFRADMAEGYDSALEQPRVNHAILCKASEADETRIA